MITLPPGDLWHDRLGIDSPERRLLSAIVAYALRDALQGNRHQAADARAYLHGPNFEADCAWLDLDPNHVRVLLAQHEQTMKRLLTDDQLRAIHAVYMANTATSLEQLARDNNVSGATLSRLFAQAGLPRRPRGNPQRGPVHGDPGEALRQLNQLIAGADGPVTTRGTIRLQLDLQIELGQTQ